MYSSTIIIKDIDTAREFVDKMSNYLDTKITLISGNYCIDGHSIIGIISLDITKPIEVIAEGNVTEDLVNVLKQYAI